MNNQQLELGFKGAKTVSPSHRHERRIPRATWWFARMRQLVDNAMEPLSEPRPEQTWMPGTHREVRL